MRRRLRSSAAKKMSGRETREMSAPGAHPPRALCHSQVPIFTEVNKNPKARVHSTEWCVFGPFMRPGLAV